MFKSLFEKILNLFKKEDKSHKVAMEALDKIDALDEIGDASHEDAMKKLEK